MSTTSPNNSNNMTKNVPNGEVTSTSPFQSAASVHAQKWFNQFETALKAGDIPAAAALFDADSYWRDLVAFSWNLVTVEGPAGVTDLLESTLSRVQPSGFLLTEEAMEAEGVTTAWFKYETSVGRGWGIIRLKGDKAWTMITALTELKGHEESRGVRRPKGAEHGLNKNRVTWQEKNDVQRAELGTVTQPYIVIIGGGQGGIALGARFRQLGVPALVLDKYARPGDQWRGRYKSLCLHDPVWYDHLPYIKFPGESCEQEKHLEFSLTLSRQLAHLLAQGQGRRLARELHQGHGDSLLVVDRGQEGHLQQGGWQVGRQHYP
jgi:putative flavoprotein involved in K+ transport